MDNKGILKFLEENACKTKRVVIKKLIDKFNLNSKVAEAIYNAWKKEYMKFKGKL